MTRLALVIAVAGFTAVAARADVPPTPEEPQTTWTTTTTAAVTVGPPPGAAAAVVNQRLADIEARHRRQLRRVRHELALERRQLVAARRRARQLKRTLLSTPSVVEAINLACATFGDCSTLWRKARCESGYSPSAKNPGSDASGLFQFMPSTFRSTPFGGFSIWSPYANALAAGWMHAHGRGGEWQCQ